GLYPPVQSFIPPLPDGSRPIRLFRGFWLNPVGETDFERDLPRASDIEDGLSQTFIVFEDAGRPAVYLEGRLTTDMIESIFIPWASPYNYFGVDVVCGGGRVINCTSRAEVYSFHPGGANFLMGDGSVRFIRQDLPVPTFAALFTPAGGEVVGSDW